MEILNYFKDNMENDNLKKEQQYAIHDVVSCLFEEVAKNSNADRSRVVAGYDNGKLCFYELDLHEETVKRYLTTVSLNVP